MLYRSLIVLAVSLLCFSGCSKDRCTEGPTALAEDIENGESLSGVWTGLFVYTTVDGELTCNDDKTFRLTGDADDSFTGNAEFADADPAAGCDPCGTFTVPSGSVDGDQVEMVWDFGFDVLATVTGTINADRTEMDLVAVESSNGESDGGGPIVLTRH
jgi:hypothetical protein